eukprot:gnl/MRDRNA2_/MRDRNA2_58704_c0_seq2.p1 gnl/MRDRNA2_/MRDRNA2_58704_c0~~gnl/MRDRNA2_/MRDRNA2_58704_c0_seq2.p1  ORF type:complete len:305 (+),score=70.10 gnl/MRDRNA2_/MRDRNA2_58704_c0_seq2:118-915(+)
MSVLTLDGVKLGDSQTAIESLFISACFFMVSRSAPAKKLAKQQPISSVFHWSVMLSLFLQLSVHCTVLINGWQLAISTRESGFKRELEGEFKPNLTNTVVFELMAAMHISSFLANYEGQPFMMPMSSNKPLIYGTIVFVATIFLTASEIIPDVNELLSLVQSPSEEFRNQILALLAFDIVGSVVLAHTVNTIAHWNRSKSADQRAKELGLGLEDDDNEDAEEEKKGKEKKEKSEKKEKKEKKYKKLEAENITSVELRKIHNKKET